VGRALQDFFSSLPSSSFVVTNDDECVNPKNGEFCSTTAVVPLSLSSMLCAAEDLRISTKIPPWSLTSAETIRANAARSRQELVGFCDNDDNNDGDADGSSNNNKSMKKFPLDVYYIHAPDCWPGWHPRCDNHPRPLLELRDAWLAMEAVVGLDHSAQRIGLSNVYPPQLLDIIQFVQERQQQALEKDGTSSTMTAPPRMPDVLQAYADPIKPADELRRICQEHGIEFVSYSTLGTQHRRRGGPDGSGGKNPVLDSVVVQGIAQKHDRSAAEVVLTWARQKNMSVIPRSSQREHIRELTRLLPSSAIDSSSSSVSGGLLVLDDEDMLQMDSLKDTA
jgi:diketogulonate reductase-like aldo/keto reductase